MKDAQAHAAFKRLTIGGLSGNYETKVDDLVRTHPELASAGSVNHIDIFHDDWCAIHGGRSCNCNPDVSIRREQ
jgi:hypothetical protein